VSGLGPVRAISPQKLKQNKTLSRKQILNEVNLQAHVNRAVFWTRMHDNRTLPDNHHVSFTLLHFYIPDVELDSPLGVTTEVEEH
jgi:hypothetical protein